MQDLDVGERLEAHNPCLSQLSEGQTAARPSSHKTVLDGLQHNLVDDGVQGPKAEGIIMGLCPLLLASLQEDSQKGQS